MAGLVDLWRYPQRILLPVCHRGKANGGQSPPFSVPGSNSLAITFASMGAACHDHVTVLEHGRYKFRIPPDTAAGMIRTCS
jgi:hypothetical protein